MNRDEIFTAITAERNYQDTKWGTSFDDKNTPNDWVSFFPQLLTKASTLKLSRKEFESAMVKIAALAVAAIESVERTGELVKRHYD